MRFFTLRNKANSPLIRACLGAETGSVRAVGQPIRVLEGDTVR
jgi:hypothetical protein